MLEFLLTAENYQDVFDKINEMNEEDKLTIYEKLNQAWDDLLYDDFFGTEGQLDPRGDHRG